MSEDLGTALLGECFGLFVDYIMEDHSNEYPDSFHHIAVGIENKTNQDWTLAEFKAHEGMARPNYIDRIVNAATGKDGPPVPAQRLPKGKSTVLYVTSSTGDPGGPYGFHLWYKVEGTDQQVIYMDWYVPRIHETLFTRDVNGYRIDHDGYNVEFKELKGRKWMGSMDNLVEVTVAVTNAQSSWYHVVASPPQVEAQFVRGCVHARPCSTQLSARITKDPRDHRKPHWSYRL